MSSCTESAGTGAEYRSRTGDEVLERRVRCDIQDSLSIGESDGDAGPGKRFEVGTPRRRSGRYSLAPACVHRSITARCVLRAGGICDHVIGVTIFSAAQAAG